MVIRVESINQTLTNLHLRYWILIQRQSSNTGLVERKISL